MLSQNTKHFLVGERGLEPLPAGRQVHDLAAIPHPFHKITWYRRRDLNPQSLQNTALNRARMPIPPLRLISLELIVGSLKFFY